MTFKSYDIFINSGAENYHYYKGQGSLSQLEITNSDQDYYQHGILSFYNPIIPHIIGDTVQIYVKDEIDNYLLFDGYICRNSRNRDTSYSYQLVGRTYDLWRYLINEEYKVTGNTAYIASSLVRNFTDETINGSHIDMDSGVDFESEFNFTNSTVGESLLQLTNLDGCKFYVDIDGGLKYYKPKISESTFTLGEDDILDMSPIEESDEDIINDCLVVGGTGYSSRLSNVYTKHAFSLTGGVYIAQRIYVPDDKFSAIKLYLDRTLDDDKPGTLHFSVRKDVGQSQSDNFEYDDIDDDTFFDPDTNINMQIYNNYDDIGYGDIGQLSQLRKYTSIDAGGRNYGLTVFESHKYHGFKIRVGANEKFTTIATAGSSSRLFRIYWTYIKNYNDGKIWCGLISGNTFNLSNMIASAATIVEGSTTAITVNWYFPGDSQPILHSGQGGVVDKYSVVIWRDDYADFESGRKDVWQGYYGSYIYSYSDDGTTWTDTNYFLHNATLHGALYYSSGTITTNEINSDCKYLLVSSQISGIYLMMSGSNDGGVTWETIDNGSEHTFSTENSQVLVKYIISSNKHGIPLEDAKISGTHCISVNNSYIRIQNALHTSGEPSDHDVEWSDEISFTASDLPYPSGWTGYKTYASPKLLLDENNYYWFLLSGGTSDKYWQIYYTSGERAYKSGLVLTSDTGEAGTWKRSDSSIDTAIKPSGDLCFDIGFSDEVVSARYQNESSINQYGRHFKKIQDNTISNYEMAYSRASGEVNQSSIPVKKGYITIHGMPNLEVYYRFSSNLSNLEVNDIWDVVSYTHRLGDTGFTTTINYGKQPYDIAKKVSDLEGSVYGE